MTSRAPIKHDLKVWPEFFEALASGQKPFELRRLDRDFREGDTLILREWSQTEGYSGREVRRVVTYILAQPSAFANQIAPGWCVMGLGRP